MSIKYKKLSNNLIVYLYGEIDEYSAKIIRTKLDELINLLKGYGSDNVVVQTI